MSLDEGDNDLTRLLTHLVAAFGTTDPDLDVAAVLASLPGDATTALTALVNTLAGAGAREPQAQWVLVLDDYHVITAPEVHEAVGFLLDHAPDQVHLMVATRADPPLPVARLRSRGQLVEIRGADLRFTPDEAQQFLNQAMGLDLEAADVNALEERTEGWIAGLQLAALSLRAIPTRPEVIDFIEAFTGSNRFVIDYLADEVLARQPPEVRDFLLRTAVLDRLTGPLCDAVSGQSAGTRCWPTSTAPTCSWCRWTPNAPGTATTTCSPTCCRHACTPRNPTWFRSCTGGPATGTRRTGSSPTPCGTRWPPRTSLVRPT